MSNSEEEFLIAIECHDVGKLRALLDAGLDPNSRIQGTSLTAWLTEMYTRSDAFSELLRLLLERGAVLDEPSLESVLLDDASALRQALQADPDLVNHRVDMVSTFMPLTGASLLHVAAEYGNLNAAKVLVESGADVNGRAAVDEYGLNGHTPIFHTLNAHNNRSLPITRLLLESGARPDILLAGITWGKGFEWETTLFDVTPLSYAQFGLLPQMHRVDHDVYDTIRVLLEAAGRDVPPLDNVPNRYLADKSGD